MTLSLGTIYPDKAECIIDLRPNENGLFRVSWKTSCMPAHAFDYMKTEEQARGFRRAFESFHDRGFLTRKKLSKHNLKA